MEKAITKLFKRDSIEESFDKIKINSDEAFEKLANKRLILRKMAQYKIPNSLRLTIGNEQANEHFIQAIGSIIK